MNPRRPGKSLTGVGQCSICSEDNIVLDGRLMDVFLCASCGSGLKLVGSEITREGITVHLNFVRTFSGYGRCPNCGVMINVEGVVGDDTLTCRTCNETLVMLVHIGNPIKAVLTLDRIHART